MDSRSATTDAHGPRHAENERLLAVNRDIEQRADVLEMAMTNILRESNVGTGLINAAESRERMRSLAREALETVGSTGWKARAEAAEERINQMAGVSCVREWGKTPMKCFPDDPCSFCRARAFMASVRSGG